MLLKLQNSSLPLRGQKGLRPKLPDIFREFYDVFLAHDNYQDAAKELFSSIDNAVRVRLGIAAYKNKFEKAPVAQVKQSKWKQMPDCHKKAFTLDLLGYSDTEIADLLKVQGKGSISTYLTEGTRATGVDAKQRKEISREIFRAHRMLDQAAKDDRLINFVFSPKHSIRKKYKSDELVENLRFFLKQRPAHDQEQVRDGIELGLTDQEIYEMKKIPVPTFHGRSLKLKQFLAKAVNDLQAVPAAFPEAWDKKAFVLHADPKRDAFIAYISGEDKDDIASRMNLKPRTISDYINDIQKALDLSDAQLNDQRNENRQVRLTKKEFFDRFIDFVSFRDAAVKRELQALIEAGKLGPVQVVNFYDCQADRKKKLLYMRIAYKLGYTDIGRLMPSPTIPGKHLSRSAVTKQLIRIKNDFLSRLDIKAKA